MIYIIITSYNEPKSTEKCINSFLSQKIEQPFKIIVCDPFLEVQKFIEEKFMNNKNIEFFLDPGEGKSYALNMVLSKIWSDNKEDIIIFTDGDVYVSENAVQEILNQFKDKEIGVVTGRPVSLNSREDMYGYWSHLLFDGIHRVRKRYAEQKKYFECSGYLFAIRNGIISDFPIDVSEDSIIPYLFWQKGYKIGYAENAKVFVLNPKNEKDWFNQKIRNIKGHENLKKYVPEDMRTKTFKNEIKKGFLFALAYPKSLKEFVWTLKLIKARVKAYKKAFEEINSKKEYSDGWRETEIKSTKPLD